MDERLRRHAADVGAGAAVHAVRLLDEHDALAETTHLRGHGLTALAEADNENISVNSVIPVSMVSVSNVCDSALVAYRTHSPRTSQRRFRTPVRDLSGMARPQLSD
jgi:hypothetical protein